MTSRLDSTPQSPESSHNLDRLDQAPPTAILDFGGGATLTENGPDETTLLLINEHNSPHLANNNNNNSSSGRLDNSV